MIVCVPVKAVKSVSRDFVLVINFGNRGTDVVRMQLLICRNVVQDDDSVVFNGRGGRVSLRIRYVWIRCGIEKKPDIIVVSVRIQRDLLLCMYV